MSSGERREQATNGGGGSGSHSPTGVVTSIKDLKSSLSSKASEKYQHQQHQGLPLNVSNVGLVGRDEELKILQDAFGRVQAGKMLECVFVSGPSGAGKSALVAGLKTHVQQSQGLFCMGKFENTNSNRDDNASVNIMHSSPFSAVQEAITNLCDAAEQRDNLHRIREAVASAIGQENCQPLTNLFPALKLFLVPPEMAPTRENTDEEDPHFLSEFAFQRLLELFRRFLKAVCSVHPVCLFLDDVQWIDVSSRRLLLAIASPASTTTSTTCPNNIDSQYPLLLIGSSRSSDDFVIFQSNPNVTSIRLGPLSEEAANTVVAKLLDLRDELTLSLSSVVFQKTKGNAFFVLQYMDMLHRKGWVRYSFKTNQWEWDAQDIAARTNVSDNVVEALLRGKIETLSLQAQQILMIAACLGYTFRTDVLETVVLSVIDYLSSMEAFQRHLRSELKGENPQMGDVDDSGSNERERYGTGEVLEMASQAGLIERLSAETFKFPHDSVQQAALRMLPEDQEGEILHLLLGEKILELSRSADSSQDWMLFSAVELLTKAAPYFSETDKSKVEQVARASLAAALKAAEKSAFMSAAKYADGGLRLLSLDQRWKDHYKLCLELNSVSFEMHYSYGNFEESTKAASEVLLNATSLEDKLPAYNVRVKIFGSQGDLKSGIKESLMALQQLGLTVPDSPTNAQVANAHERVRNMMGGRKPRDLIELSWISDPMVVETIRVLHTNTVYAWHAGQANLCIRCCLHMMELTLEHGICQFSPHSLAVYGGLISNFGQLDDAFEFGTLATELLERPGMKEEAPISIKVIHLFLNHLRRPLHESLDPLLQGYKMGMASGDVQVASRLLTLHATLSVVAGMPVESLAKQIEGYCSFFREYRQHDCLLEISPWLHLARNMTGDCENPLVLQGSAEEEKEIAELMKDPLLKADITIQLHMVLARLLIYCSFGEFELGLAECENLKVFENITYSYCLKPFLIFFSGLTYLGLAQEKKMLKRRALKRRGQVCMAELKKFGSMNCVPMLMLLEAERAALGEKKDKVMKAYSTAINMSGRSGFRLIKAMACERAGDYLLSVKERHQAVGYLEQASVAFMEYGAKGKLNQMKKKYEGLVEFTMPFSEDAASKSRSSLSMQPYMATEWKKEVARGDAAT